MVLMYFFLPEDSVAIVAASPLASGDSSNDVALGIARNSPSSLKLVTTSPVGPECGKLHSGHHVRGRFMRYSRIAIAAVAVAIAAVGLGRADASAPHLTNLVGQRPVTWTPNVSAGTAVGQGACDATYFGSGSPRA